MTPIHKEGNKSFNYLVKYDCTTFFSCVNVLNENTVRTEGIQITLYFIMSSISLYTLYTLFLIAGSEVFKSQYQIISIERLRHLKGC